MSWCNLTALFQYGWKPLIMQTALPASISREKWAIILMELPNWSHAYCMGYNVFLSELCSEVPPCFIFKWMCISHVVCTQYDYENSLIYLLSKHISTNLNSCFLTNLNFFFLVFVKKIMEISCAFAVHMCTVYTFQATTCTCTTCATILYALCSTMYKVMYRCT